MMRKKKRKLRKRQRKTAEDEKSIEPPIDDGGRKRKRSWRTRWKEDGMRNPWSSRVERKIMTMPSSFY